MISQSTHILTRQTTCHDILKKISLLISLGRNRLAYSPKNERNPNDDPSSMPDWIDGTEINESQSLALVLKKNRYFLNTSTVEGSASTTPLIRPEDIEWYMPASGQFAGMPGWYGGAAATPGDYWSSTAATGTNSYIGNGMALPRTTVKNIRVMRNRP